MVFQYWIDAKLTALFFRNKFPKPIFKLFLQLQFKVQSLLKNWTNIFSTYYEYLGFKIPFFLKKYVKHQTVFETLIATIFTDSKQHGFGYFSQTLSVVFKKSSALCGF